MGSPAETGVRTMAPTKSLIASGRSLFLTKFEFAESAGQVLPADIPFPDHLAGVEIGLGYKHFNCGDRLRRWRRFGVSVATRENWPQRHLRREQYPIRLRERAS